MVDAEAFSCESPGWREIEVDQADTEFTFKGPGNPISFIWIAIDAAGSNASLTYDWNASTYTGGIATCVFRSNYNNWTYRVIPIWQGDGDATGADLVP